MIDTNVNLSANARVESALYAALDEVWGKGEADGMEHIIQLSSTGEVLGRADGGANSVEWPVPGEAARGTILVHNHPREYAMSLQDIMGGLVNKAPLYAITRKRAVTWVSGKRLPRTDSAGPVEFLGLGELALDGIVFGLEEANVLHQGDEATGVAAHFANIILDRANLIEYRFCFPPEVEKEVDALASKLIIGLPTELQFSSCRQSRCWRDRVEVA